jgi:hypothetical protein
VLILDINKEKAFSTLHYLLEQKAGSYDVERRDNTIYTFFTKDNSHYVLIADDGFYAVCILHPDITHTISIENLIQGQSLKSQITWDLLEQDGIREYSFHLLYKGRIPESTKHIDFNDIQR